jgi:hypothetical protein
MSAGLKVIVLDHAAARQAPCFCCSATSGLVGPGAVLRDPLPLGPVCVGCLEAGPARAALHLRGRAGQLRALARCAPLCLHPSLWPRVMGSLHALATDLDGAAGRLEALGIWPFPGD